MRLFLGSLQCLTEIALLDLQRRGGPTEAEIEAAREVGLRLAHAGDEVEFRDGQSASTGEAPSLAEIARSLAILAYFGTPLDALFQEAI
jgi:hypothetical protein